MPDNRVPIPALMPAVLDAMRDAAREFGLRADHLALEYVLNWGGFGNASFTVDDGHRKLHLKLAPDAQGQEPLRRWQRCGSILETRYHAPPMLGWLTVPGTSYGGPVFEWVDGNVLRDEQAPSVLPTVLNAVGRLHTDRELAEHANRSIITHFDCFHSRFVDMLREDLACIRAERPPFISADRIAWMTAEVAALEESAMKSGAFDAEARSIIHWDLWWNNILITATSRWYILDWDDLGLGDPALDFATAIFPLTCGPAARDWRSFGLPESDFRFDARMALYRQALMLDWVIDVLADWIDCREAPATQAEVRAHKQADHERFLKIYEKEYGTA